MLQVVDWEITKGEGGGLDVCRLNYALLPRLDVTPLPRAPPRGGGLNPSFNSLKFMGVSR